MSAQRVKVFLGSETGAHTARFNLFDLPPREESTSFEVREIDLALPAYYPLKNLCLYEINLTLTQSTDENMLRQPYLFQIIPLR